MSDGDGPYFSGGRAVSFLVIAALLLAVSMLPRDWNPLWVAGGLLLGIPVVAVVAIVAWFLVGNIADRRAYRRRCERHVAGLCVGCGYDVRDIDQKCPECGMPIWRPRDPLTGKVLSDGRQRFGQSTEAR